jgi:NAD(P)-dependent dehydrogenase (short-subunit alcohol dehydrogenase family)
LKQAADVYADGDEIRLVIDATGFFHNDYQSPERTWLKLNADQLTRAFAVDTIGTALFMKHVLFRLPRSGKALFSNLSARIGSISDNHLGGWCSYRASKAAINQMVRTEAVGLARRAPEAICVAASPANSCNYLISNI